MNQLLIDKTVLKSILSSNTMNWKVYDFGTNSMVPLKPSCDIYIKKRHTYINPITAATWYSTIFIYLISTLFSLFKLNGF